jgi:hypothetical protein
MSAATKLTKQINDYLIQLNDKQNKSCINCSKNFC